MLTFRKVRAYEINIILFYYYDFYVQCLFDLILSWWSFYTKTCSWHTSCIEWAALLSPRIICATETLLMIHKAYSPTISIYYRVSLINHTMAFSTIMPESCCIRPCHCPIVHINLFILFRNSTHINVCHTLIHKSNEIFNMFL